MLSKLIVPSVTFCILYLSIPLCFITRNCFHLVFRSLFTFCCVYLAVYELLVGANLIHWHSSHYYWRSLKMNSFMLNPHHNDPGIWVPTDKWISFFNYFQNYIFDFIAKSSNFSNRRPVIMLIVEIIPVHFINSNFKECLEFRVNSLWNQTFIK